MTHLTFSRSARTLACRLALLMPGLWLSTAATLAAEQTPDIGGVWQITAYSPAIRTLDGALPPLTDAGKAAYASNLQARKELKPRNDMTRCVPSGTPRAMFAPLPLLILQTARKITFIQEYHHQLRHIYLDEPLPDPEAIELSFMGESTGHWEGDTLVIGTIGLHRDTVLDREGMPHSTAMTLTERLRLIDDGQHLENVMTFTDPEYYSAPWSARAVYERKPGVQLKEYNCLSLHEDL